MLSAIQSSAIPDFRAMVDSKPTKVKRCLFGEPDHTHVRAELVRQLAVIAQRDADRWNFDFTNEKPMDGLFSWEIITPCTEAVTRSSAIKTPESSPRHSDSSEVMSSPELISRLQPAEECQIEEETVLERCTRSAKQNKITDFYANKKRSAALCKSPKTALKRKRSMSVEPLSPESVSLSPTSRPKRRCRQH